MMNPFPILFLSLLAHLLLRIFVGGTYLYLGFYHYRSRYELGLSLTTNWFRYGMFAALLLAATELVIGALFILGAFTQYAALASLLLCATVILIRNRFFPHLFPTKLSYVLLFGASLSLFITGAGALAFDLPI